MLYTIGHSCNALLLNFWDHEQLASEEQESYGNLGYIWLTKYSNNNGHYNMSIDTKVAQIATGIYFEIDNGQGFTAVQQDPLYLEIEFYPYVGQINFLATYLPIAFSGLTFLGVIVALSLKKR